MVIKCQCIEMNQVGKEHLVSKTMRLLSKKTIIYLDSVLPYLLKLLVMKVFSLSQNLCLKVLANVHRTHATFRNTLSMG